MPTTKSFADLVRRRAKDDAGFADALLREGVDALLDGETETGMTVLRDYLEARYDSKRAAASLFGTRGHAYVCPSGGARMSRSITMTFPHDLGVAEAKRRIAERFELLKREYVDKVGNAEIAWVGDTAHLRVAALGQTATAEIDIQPADIRIEVHLPWLLAAMANKIEKLMKSNAQDTLRIGTTKKV